MRTGSSGTQTCTPANCTTTTLWAVTATSRESGPLDTVTGQMLCGDAAIVGCPARGSPFGNRACTTGFVRGTDGAARCRLVVNDELNGLPVRDPVAVCYDPADPTRLIPAEIEFVHTARITPP